MKLFIRQLSICQQEWNTFTLSVIICNTNDGNTPEIYLMRNIIFKLSHFIVKFLHTKIFDMKFDNPNS